MLNRLGTTLVELMVGLVLASIVLGIATVTTLRQHRVHARIQSVSDVDAQLRSAMLVLGAQLSVLDGGVGDLASGQATDTSLQFRAPIATSIACSQALGAVTLRPDAAGEIPLSGQAVPTRVSDTLWWLGDSAWTGQRVTSVATTWASCAAPVATVGSSARLGITGTDTIPAGSPIRITRQTRYAIYRASDGTWQLGFREWNDPTFQFAAPQPVAGPLLIRSGTRHSGFRYFDTTGAELLPSAGPVDVTRVARIRITAHSLVPDRSAGQDSVRTDSLDIALTRVSVP
ncbi:MAG: hypothetical protein ABJE47_02800 [bacterium]